MNSIIKKTVAILLSLVTFFSIGLTANAYTDEDLVEAAEVFIFRNEGNYNSILANDNGAVSLGRIGWHAGRALYLLQIIVKANDANARKILTDSLYNEIVNSDPQKHWKSRILTTEECKYVKELLSTPESKKAQDDLARSDLLGYINWGRELGLVDGNALIFFADLNNQLGPYGAKAKVDTALRLGMAPNAKSITLDILYKASIVETTSATRRRNCYEYCAALPFGSSSSYTPPTYEIGKYIVTAQPSLRIRSGPSVSYAYTGVSVPNGVTIVITEISGGWGKTTYSGKTGWVSLEHATKISSPDNGTFKLGDVNFDGSVTVADARLAIRIATSLEKVSDTAKKAADVDKNGKVTSSDARMILRVATKLDSF